MTSLVKHGFGSSGWLLFLTPITFRGKIRGRKELEADMVEFLPLQKQAPFDRGIGSLWKRSRSIKTLLGSSLVASQVPLPNISTPFPLLPFLLCLPAMPRKAAQPPPSTSTMVPEEEGDLATQVAEKVMKYLEPIMENRIGTVQQSVAIVAKLVDMNLSQSDDSKHYLQRNPDIRYLLDA